MPLDDVLAGCGEFVAGPAEVRVLSRDRAREFWTAWVEGR
jgi:hypothetical protein